MLVAAAAAAAALVLDVSATVARALVLGSVRATFPARAVTVLDGGIAATNGTLVPTFGHRPSFQKIRHSDTPTASDMWILIHL